MNKEMIIAFLKEKGITDETTLETAGEYLEGQHNDAVQSLAQNKATILDEKKKIQSDLKEIEKNFNETKAHLDRYKSIPDPSAALKALEMVKSGNMERDVDKEIQEAVQARTITLIEENTQVKSEIESVKSQMEQANADFVRQSREKDFENQITISAQANNIDPMLMPEYRFNVKSVFQEYDEDSGRYVARHPDGKPMFGKVATVKPVDINLYTSDYLLADKPFFKKGNFTNPTLSGSGSSGPDYSDMFYMRGTVAKATEDGLKFATEKPSEFAAALKKFEAKNNNKVA